VIFPTSEPSSGSWTCSSFSRLASRVLAISKHSAQETAADPRKDGSDVYCAVYSLTVAGDLRSGADTVRSYEADHSEEQASTKKHMYALPVL